jgi:flagellar basal-body rod protein FlgG
MADSLSALMQVAASGMLAEQFHIEALSNNIANMDTPGYKRTRVNFQEMLGTQTGGGGTTQGELIGLGGVMPTATQRVFTQGELRTTDNPWDLAIAGEGFFKVTLADGRSGYTRDGTFRPDATGRLVTAQGYSLDPPIAIPADTEQVHVNPDGTVMVKRVGSVETEQIGTIPLTRFANPEGLEAIGNNLYVATEASGTPEEGTARQNGFGEIVSQAREDSNVSLSEEMTEMIVAQRAYSLALRAVQTVDQMMALANELRP